MIRSKYITAIVAVLVLLALLGTFWMVSAADNATAAVPEYEKKLFNGEVVSIEIEVDADDWQSLLDNAQSKEYISADLIINGERFSTVGIRTKGNSSLSSATNDRYSLQLNPNKYVKGQSFYGLDTMCLNNLMGDATYMKDYISYEIMDYLEVPSALHNYASVTVNGEDYGLFLLLERYDDSFLDRTYGSSTGELYNVKIQMGERTDFEEGGFEPVRPEGAEGWGNMSPENAQGEEEAATGQGDAEGQGAAQGGAPPDMPEGEMPADMPQGMPQGEGGMQVPEDTATQEDGGAQEGITETTQTEEEQETQQEGRRQGGGMEGGMFSSGGGSLVYTDDDPASYGSIFNNAVSDKVSDKDQQQVITAIEKLNAGEELEEYWDVDEILRYLAAHTFVVNLDSYVSSMQQNYYLLERNGVISILPWDYNLAFGGYNSREASDVVNFAIDTPVSGVEMEDRPLVGVLLAVEEYRERYHEYLNDIVEGYVNSGLFEETVDRVSEQIGEYVKTDATAYYTYEEYETALTVFKELVALRAESVAGQLDGSVPSTTEGQQAQPELLVDASGIDLAALGTMGGGGSMGGMGGFGGREQSTAQVGEEQTADETGSAQEDETRPVGDDAEPPTDVQQNGQATAGGMPDMAEMQSLMEAAQNGTLTDEQREQLAAMGMSEEDLESFGGMGQNMPGGFGGGPGGQQSGTVTNVALTQTDWILYGALGALLVVAIVLVANTKRRKWVRKK